MAKRLACRVHPQQVKGQTIIDKFHVEHVGTCPGQQPIIDNRETLHVSREGSNRLSIGPGPPKALGVVWRGASGATKERLGKGYASKIFLKFCNTAMFMLPYDCMEITRDWIRLITYEWNGFPRDTIIPFANIERVIPDSPEMYHTNGTVVQTSSNSFLVPLEYEKFVELVGSTLDIRAASKEYLDKVQ